MTEEEIIIRRFKNHCEIHGWPTKSFKQKVKKYLKSKTDEQQRQTCRIPIK